MMAAHDDARAFAELSLAEKLAAMSPEGRRAWLEKASAAELEYMPWNWDLYARPKQRPPKGEWSTWVVRAGRGFGKTRTGAGWIHARAMEYAGRWIALVADTPADARDYMGAKALPWIISDAPDTPQEGDTDASGAS